MRKRPEPKNAGPEDKALAPDSDVECFALAMADVVRLPPDPRGRVRNVRPIGVWAAAPAPSSSPIEMGDEPADADFAAPGVDRRAIRRLKRGEHTPGERLDLHGRTAADAVQAVRRFVDESRHRCVCIVHGRGLHSEGHVSILRMRVREFLRHHRAVLAFSDAPRGDGGPGAVYVLLRK